jgi:predicted transcriptional regulator
MAKQQETFTVKERRKPPFLWISKHVFVLHWHELSDKATRLYVTLCAYADGDHSGDGVAIALESLTKRNSMSLSSVHRALRELEQAGLIGRERDFDENGVQTYTRFILLD